MSNRGFSAVEGLMIIGIVVILGLVGWKAYDAFIAPSAAPQAEQWSNQSVNEIKSPEDVDKASAELEQMQDGDAELRVLEQELNF